MIKLEPLTGRHDRSGFDCGAGPLNLWLRQVALQHQVKGISRTIVAVPGDAHAVEAFRHLGYSDIVSASIIGFYALAAAFVVIEEIPRKSARRLPRQVPVTRLGRLAVRADMQRQGIGELLLADAVNRARGAAQAVGSAGMVVDAKDENAARFYAGYGFAPCEDQPMKLYLAIWLPK